MEKELDFQYENIIIYIIVYILIFFSLVLLAFSFYSYAVKHIPFVLTHKSVIWPLMIVVFLIIGAVVMRMPGLFTYRKGVARFYEDYIELYYNENSKKIFYSEIENIKIENVGNMGQVKNSKVTIITNNDKISFHSARKEESYKKQHNYSIEHFSLTIMARELESRIKKQHEISSNTEVGTLTEYANDYWLNAKEPDYAKAESLYRQALEEQPDNPEALTMYAEMLFMTGRDSEAEALYEQACEIDSSFAENPVNHYEALGNKEREAYWRNKMKIEVKKSNNTVFAKSITKKEKKRHKIVSIIEKKRYKIVSIICLLDFIFVVSVKLLMNNGSVDFFTGVILIVSGIIPCGIMACYILSVIVDWSYGFIAKYKHNIIRDFIFTLIFGIGMRGAGIVPMFVLIVISCVPTLLGLMVSNAILGNGICSGI